MIEETTCATKNKYGMLESFKTNKVPRRKQNEEVPEEVESQEVRSPRPDDPRWTRYPDHPRPGNPPDRQHLAIRHPPEASEVNGLRYRRRPRTLPQRRRQRAPPWHNLNCRYRRRTHEVQEVHEITTTKGWHKH